MPLMWRPGLVHTHCGGMPSQHRSHYKKNNAAVQLVHAMIRHASKGGAALQRSPLTLLTCDAGVISQTTSAQLTALLSDGPSPPQPAPEGEVAHLVDLIDPDCFLPNTSPNYADVTIDPKRLLPHLYKPHESTNSDIEATTAPSYIPPWILSTEQTNKLRHQGLGVTPDLIYARGVPNVPNPNPSSFNKAECTLLLIEVGFGSDLNLKAKLEEKTLKYQPLLDELKKDWGGVHLVCVPIGHAGTLLAETAEHLAMALATRRPQVGQAKTVDDPTADRHALTHDRRLANNLLQQLSDLAATRLLQTLAHRAAEIRKLSTNSPPPFAPHKRRTDPSSIGIT